MALKSPQLDIDAFQKRQGNAAALQKLRKIAQRREENSIPAIARERADNAASGKISNAVGVRGLHRVQYFRCC